MPAVQAYVRYLQGQINGAIIADSSELEVRKLLAETEEREAKARMAELDLAVMQGRLHEAEHVQKIMTDMIVACRSLLLSIPAKVSPVLVEAMDARAIAATLREQIDEALETLADYDADTFNELNEKYVPPGAGDDAD